MRWIGLVMMDTVMPAANYLINNERIFASCFNLGPLGVHTNDNRTYNVNKQ